MANELKKVTHCIFDMDGLLLGELVDAFAGHKVVTLI